MLVCALNRILTGRNNQCTIYDEYNRLHALPKFCCVRAGSTGPKSAALLAIFTRLLCIHL